MRTSVEFMALGGACDRQGLKPPIGGSCYCLRVGNEYLLIDSGAYFQPEKGVKASVKEFVPEIKLQTIGGVKIPILPEFTLFDDRDYIPREQQDSLPLYDKIKDASQVYAVVTHAHIDHNGSTPLLGRLFPNAQFLMTRETFAISEWSWEDGLKIARQRRQKSLYTREDMANLGKRIVYVSPGETKTFGPFELSFFSSGHILGGVSVFVKLKDHDNKTFFFTSDIAFQNQRTIQGAPLLSKEVLGELDYLVTETTYAGNTRSRLPRSAVEASLAWDINLTLQNGGKVLLPALSVGRSAEIISMLDHYGFLSQWSVWVDGSARDILRIYKDSGALKANFREVPGKDAHERISIINDPAPCIILAPSGMIKGGWSPFYAKHLVKDSRNLIALTCYQMRGSPGHQLLELKKQKGWRRKVLFGDREKPVPVRAKICSYHLSAHADGSEIEEMIKRMSPRRAALLIHGELGGMNALKRRLKDKIKIKIADLGDSIAV